MSITVDHVSEQRKTGPIIWLFSFQFMLVEYLISWTTAYPYSYFDNYISDLGSAYCADLTSGFTDAVHRVCSPLHNWMNLSFVVQGVLLAVGAVYMRKRFPAMKPIRFSLLLLMAAGVGFVAAGLAPNDVNLPVHYAGAVLALFGGGIGITLIGATLLGQESNGTVFALLTIASGVLSLGGTILLSSGITLGLGVGGMERVAAYPVELWPVLAGAYYLLKGSR